jgi:hypothetical protein
MMIDSWMVTCPERDKVRDATLASLAETDWGQSPKLVIDERTGATSLERIGATWWRALERAASSTADLVVLFEDDLRFNKHLRHNLEHWRCDGFGPGGLFREHFARASPVRSQGAVPGAREHFFGSLYNPARIPSIGTGLDFFIAEPAYVWGSQAIVMTPRTLRCVANLWASERGNPDERMPRLASRWTAIFYHVPSLVDHVGESTWGAGQRHWAPDFDPNWRAPAR